MLGTNYILCIFQLKSVMINNLLPGNSHMAKYKYNGYAQFFHIQIKTKCVCIMPKIRAQY